MKKLPLSLTISLYDTIDDIKALNRISMKTSALEILIDTILDTKHIELKTIIGKCYNYLYKNA